MWSRQLSQTGVASSLKCDKSAQKRIVYDMFVVSTLNSLIPNTNRHWQYWRLMSIQYQYRSQPTVFSLTMHTGNQVYTVLHRDNTDQQVLA